MDRNEESAAQPEISQQAAATTSALLPEKSKWIYDKTYRSFNDWRLRKKTDSFSENVLLDYFAELSETYKSSSLWSFYSMLKSVLRINHDIDLETYGKLRVFLKRNSEGYEAKKSSTLTPKEIKEFIAEAPDKKFLIHKVILIIGVVGACRSNELYEMKIEDVKDLQTMLLITIPKTKTKTVRTFTITNPYYNIVKKYINLRPAHVKINAFFLNYQKFKCTVQRIGKNKFSLICKQIAKYLKLPNAETYTGHCYRRSSATLCSREGGDVTGLTEGYVDQSMRNYYC